MAEHPQPHHITLGGREAVALTLEEYEQLIASRRQIGGQSARVRVLAQRAKESEELLREIEALVGCPSHGCHGLRDRRGRGSGRRGGRTRGSEGRRLSAVCARGTAPAPSGVNGRSAGGS